MTDTTESTTESTAPAYIERDTYTGRWSVTKATTNTEYGVGRAFAHDLAARHGRAPFIIWEFSGHTPSGQRLFHRSRYLADADGNLHGYDSNGRKVIVHPADREVRFLTHVAR